MRLLVRRVQERQQLAELRQRAYPGFTELLEADSDAPTPVPSADPSLPMPTDTSKETPPEQLSPHSKLANAQAEYELSLSMPRQLTKRLGDAGCRFVEDYVKD
eukprot:5245311-Prymnesium_polylepis.1